MTLEFFKNRATVRVFDGRPVSDDIISALARAAAQAPNTGNMQLYTLIATRDSETKQVLAKLHFNQPAATGAPVLLTVCADIRRFGQWCTLNDAVSGLDNFGGWLSAIMDASIFAQQFVTAAEQNGLGCCILGTATYNLQGFIEALDLPQGVLPVLGIALGYPAEKEHPVSDRLPLEAVLHFEKYHDATPAEIKAFYAEKEAMSESQIFVKENHKKTLAQVYADIRYPRATNEAVAAAILPLITP